jgi:putative ABC transport system ATP-binding protein
MLDMLSLTSRAKLLPQALSGGEKQRLAIGRAFIKGPDLCFADEPTSALDWEHGKPVVEFLRELVRLRNAMVLVVSHDSRMLPFADRLLYLEDGELIE